MPTRDTTRARAGARLAKQKRMAEELRRWGWDVIEPRDALGVIADLIRFGEGLSYARTDKATLGSADLAAYRDAIR